MSSSWARGLPGSLRLPGWERRDSLPSVLKVATGSVAASSPNTTPSVTYRSKSVLFSHGRPPEIWDPLRRNKIEINEVRGHTCCRQNGTLTPCDFFPQVDAVLQEMMTALPTSLFSSSCTRVVPPKLMSTQNSGPSTMSQCSMRLTRAGSHRTDSIFCRRGHRHHYLECRVPMRGSVWRFRYSMWSVDPAATGRCREAGPSQVDDVWAPLQRL